MRRAAAVASTRTEQVELPDLLPRKGQSWWTAQESLVRGRRACSATEVSTNSERRTGRSRDALVITQHGLEILQAIGPRAQWRARPAPFAPDRVIPCIEPVVE